MTDAQVFVLIEQYHVPQHVRRHCMQVGRLAAFLAEKMHARGLSVDPLVVRHAGFLHDIVKIVDFRPWDPHNLPQIVTDDDVRVWEAVRTRFAGVHHADAGATIVREAGEHVLATIIAKHKFSSLFDMSDPLSTWEEKLVYYADKRVKHDKIVSLAERLHDFRVRYNITGAQMEESLRAEYAIKALEKEICAAAGITDPLLII